MAALLGLVFIANLMIGPTFAFGGFYALTVCMTAWMAGFGRAVLLGAVALTGSTIINGAGGPFGGASLPWGSVTAWTAVILRAIALLCFVSLIARIRDRYRQACRAARRDPLTGLHNHRAFREHLDQVIARAQRFGTAVALGYIDLDDFKGINDRLGHVAGDRMLQHFSLAARESLRRNDCMGRMGGDEFAIVIEARDREEATLAIVRAHTALKRALARHGDPLSFSMGAAITLPSRNADGSTLIHAADSLMYRSKREAKGELVLAGSGRDTAPSGHARQETDAATALQPIAG